MSTVLETATARNIEELMKIERECFAAEAYTRGQILFLLNSRNSIAPMVRLNSDVAGFAIGVIETSRGLKIGHIVTIDVAVKYRRRGVAQILLSELEKRLSNKGATAMYLEVRIDNRAARRLYEKQGYEEAESLEHYYPYGVRGMRLVKRLDLKQSASS